MIPIVPAVIDRTKSEEEKEENAQKALIQTSNTQQPANQELTRITDQLANMQNAQPTPKKRERKKTVKEDALLQEMLTSIDRDVNSKLRQSKKKDYKEEEEDEPTYELTNSLVSKPPQSRIDVIVSFYDEFVTTG